MPRYVTLTLYVHEDLTGPTADTATSIEYMRSCMDGDPPVVVSSWAVAYKILRRLGLNVEEARHRINFARTGDMYATRPAARRPHRRPARLGS